MQHVYVYESELTREKRKTIQSVIKLQSLLYLFFGGFTPVTLAQHFSIYIILIKKALYLGLSTATLL